MVRICSVTFGLSYYFNFSHRYSQTMKKFFFVCLMAVSVATASCQSKSYKIEGTADGLADGDVVYVTTDMRNGTPLDSASVKDGKFELTAKTDTVEFAYVYSSRHNNANVPFFIEPGTIHIHLSDSPQKTKVSGTETNDRWQTLNDSIVKIYVMMNAIASDLYGNKLTSEEQKARTAEIGRLNERCENVLVDCAEKNIDNELGYFLITGDYIDDTVKQRLIAKMPDKFRKRAAVVQLSARLATMAKYAVGRKIDDFTMADINGKPVNVMGLVAKNKITVIDFWASWCGPCRSEMPLMVRMYGKYKAFGLGIVGISLDSNKAQWAKATEALGITWPQMSDLKGWENSAAQMFSVRSIPYTIVVDQNGTILQKGLRGEKLQEYVDSQLKKAK